MGVREFSSWSIISMEINNEKFKELQQPKDPSETNCVDLGVLEGCLCLCVLVNDVQDYVQVWVMQEYGVRESWTQCYVITHEKIVNAYCLSFGYSLKLTWSFENGEMLFRLHEGILVLYDPKHENAREPNISSLFSAGEENYFESLVSLHSGTYVGGEAEIKESIETW
ncbi:F-box protein CPR1-like [Papaver somniferum]|uniref:F-box protein CPR1-like n=1 Tax=Papaver somniferum TaxID=3469 RepID=UPI000E6FB3CB|nr:F-box protein CPR1-like [Papaver somniferum]